MPPPPPTVRISFFFIYSVKGRDLHSILTSCSYTKQYVLNDYFDLPKDIRAILLSTDLPVTILHLLDPVSVRLIFQQLLLGCSNHLLLLRHPAGQLKKSENYLSSIRNNV